MYYPPNHGGLYRAPVNTPVYPPTYQQNGMYWQHYQNPNPLQHQFNGPNQFNGPQQGGPVYPQQQPRPRSDMWAAFKTKDGKFDFDKASNTLDQVVKVGSQISPIVKQVGGFFITKD